MTEQRPSQEAQVAIIGAGPIGLEVACALKAQDTDFVHFEAGSIGSTMGWWAPGTTFFSSPERIQIAGVPLVTPDQQKATRECYLAYLRQVVLGHDLDVHTNTRVVGAERQGQHFVLTTRPSVHGVGGPAEGSRDGKNGASDRSWRVHKIILAIGNMHRPRRLGIPGENLPFVSHFLDDPHVYFRKRVLIVGGKNSAVEAAIRLYRTGTHVAISYRGREFSNRVKYWLRPELEWLIETGRIEFHPQTTPERISEYGSVVLRSADAQDKRSIDAQFVLLLTGYTQDTQLLDMLGVQTTGADRAPVFDEGTMETNVPGVFVAGTALGGTPVEGVKVFIETSHDHARRIAAALAGRDVPEDLPQPEWSLPES